MNKSEIKLLVKERIKTIPYLEEFLRKSHNYGKFVKNATENYVGIGKGYPPTFDSISNPFTYSNTPQGYGYWDNVREHYHDYVDEKIEDSLLKRRRNKKGNNRTPF